MSLDDQMAAAHAVTDILELPAGDYAIVEVMGHRTMIGRLSEVERFGTNFAAIEPIWKDQLLPPVLVGGASIYQLTPCTAETAKRRQAKYEYQLPAPVRESLPEEPPLQIEAQPAEAKPEHDLFDNHELAVMQTLGENGRTLLSDFEHDDAVDRLIARKYVELLTRGSADGVDSTWVSLTPHGEAACADIDDYIPF